MTSEYVLLGQCLIYSLDCLFCYVWGWMFTIGLFPLQWRHNERDGVSNHPPHHYLLNRLFRHRWKKTSKLRVTGLCEGNSAVTDEFPAQRASNAQNVFIWWCHHAQNSFNECDLHIYTEANLWYEPCTWSDRETMLQHSVCLTLSGLWTWMSTYLHM